MARDRSAGRVEPNFGAADTSGMRVDPEDRPATAVRSTSRRAVAPAAAPAPRGRRARREARRARHSWPVRLFRRTFYWGLVLSLWGFIAVAGLVAYYAMQLPGASEWKVPDRPPNVQIVSADGTVMGNRGDTGGESVRMAQLPEYVPNAVIAIEDRRFRSHFGLDPIGLTRAVAKNAVAGGVVEGGSTLTQQLAKNMFLSQERSLRRKVQELVLAVWLETKFSKEEILEMYLNRVYFGSGAYGIDAAARRYFDRPAAELTLPQAAMLAGLLPAPSTLAPNKNPEGAKQRATLVIAAMLEQGYITAEEAEAALQSPAKAASLHMTRSDNYVADWVMEVLAFHVGTIDRDVIVDTTIDLKMQDAAERALHDVLEEQGGKLKVSDGALVALDGTGAVRAMVGGRDYAASQFNRAVTARRQPGSAFKPFVYLAALERGATPDMLRMDEPVTFGKWSPKNYDNEFHGLMTLKVALAKSINTIAAQLAVEVGPETVVQTARRMGINSPLEPNPSIALGTSEVTLLELTGAYAPFSNGGFAALPHVIRKITTVDGTVLFDRSGSGLGRVVSLQNVAMMNDMLRATMERGTGTKAQIAGWPAAGKTGTTQASRDAWFVGYTANLTAGVWIGNDDNEPTKRVTGGSLPAVIWGKFMTEALKGIPVADLPGADLAPAVATAPELGAGEQVAAGGQGGELDSWIAQHSASGAPPVEAAPQPQYQPQFVRVERRSLLDRILGR